MNFFFALILVLVPSIPSWAESASADAEWKQPYPHSSGAELLPYCLQTDLVVSQLRCDYYVQGVADLATTPVKGIPLACIPRGQNRTELMQLAVDYLTSIEPDSLKENSAASLLLIEFRKKFPCPKAIKKKAPISKAMAEAIKRSLEKTAKEQGVKSPK